MRKQLQRWVILACLLVFSGSGALWGCEFQAGHSDPVAVFPPKFKANAQHEEYTFKLLQLVLKKSEEKYGPCTVVHYSSNIPLARSELYLQREENIHVVSLTVTRERDERFLAVRIPLSRGLRGLRLMLIRRGEQQRFSSIRSLDDLRKLTAGQGEKWVDTDVLRQNGLPVLTTGNVNALAGMLASKRFDYFPRGARELVAELRIYKQLPIMLESDLVLSYPNLTAFYVSRQNYELAHRLEYGLEQAYKDSSFDAFFYNHHSIVEALENMDLQHRRVLHLCNPYLPPWVPVHIDKYWLVPWPQDMQTDVCLGRRPRQDEALKPN